MGINNQMQSNRLNALNGHFEPQVTSFQSQVGPKHDDDVVIVAATRTAITRAKKGYQATTAPEAMLKPIFEAVIKKGGIKPADVGEITIGNCLQGGAGAASSRMGQFLAGIPETTPL